MARLKARLSIHNRATIALLTALGTAGCIAVAFAIDSYSFETGGWRWGESPWNNFLIPFVLAPPLFYFLLSRQRALAIAHQELLVVASTDVLTACLNRRAFTTLVDAYLEKVARQEASREGALLVIDVDHFKAVNDSFGHEMGDEALKIVASTIKSNVREIDLVGRIGGEEFSVFLPGVNVDRAEEIAERIRGAVDRALFAPRGNHHHLAVSIGGASFVAGRATFSDLFRQADQSLYSAKRNGRNRVEMRKTAPPDRSAAQLH